MLIAKLVLFSFFNISALEKLYINLETNIEPLSLLSVRHFSRLPSESGLEKEPNWCGVSLSIPLSCFWDCRCVSEKTRCTEVGHVNLTGFALAQAMPLKCLYHVLHSCGLQESILV